MKKLLSRSIFKELDTWETSPIRSPLLLIGARQVGKTTVLKAFAERIGKRVFEINFWRDSEDLLKNLFKRSNDAEVILQELADYFNIAEIDIEHDVLFIDEIQECPEAYSALKSFKEQKNRLRVLVTGSYLQLFMKNDSLKKLPVGCVDELTLKPMNFSEVLQNSDELLYSKYLNLKCNTFQVTSSLHHKLMKKMEEFFFTGGLPEVVFLYINSPSGLETNRLIRKKQNDLISQYTIDFQKYGKSSHIKKIDKLFQNIPLQLEISNEDSVKRFYYKELGKNAKYDIFHWSFQFLESSGLIIRSFFIDNPSLPFKVHNKLEERNIFKCFYFDIGLLNAVLNSPLNTHLKALGSYKGYLAENFVAMELFSCSSNKLVTYKKNSKNESAEIEFLILNDNNEIIPIEVKSSAKSLKSKSLASYIKQFKPKIAYKLVPTDGQNLNSKGFQTIPLYMAGRIV